MCIGLFVNRRSVDGGSVSSGLTQSYASLMADYRARLGMASSSSGSAKAPEVPTVRTIPGTVYLIMFLCLATAERLILYTDLCQSVC